MNTLRAISSRTALPAARPSRRVALRCRATNEPQQPQKYNNTVFYGGSTYSESEVRGFVICGGSAHLAIVCGAETTQQPCVAHAAPSPTTHTQKIKKSQWNEAIESGNIAMPAPVTASSGSAAAPTLADVMAFSGPGPEIINGRLAQLGIVAAIGAELATGQPVLQQWSEEPTGIALAFVLVIAGSLIALAGGANSQEVRVGPLHFTKNAELLNSRAAMIGFASLVAIELAKGSALF